MLKLVRIEAPKIYLTVRFTELEAGTLATCELCLFVLLYLAFASVESPISCELPAIWREFWGGLPFLLLVGFWRKWRNSSDSLIIEDLDVPYTCKISRIRIAFSSWFSFLGLRADVVVFYPTPNVHFQAIGWDSIEQAILFERRATRGSQDRAPKWQARAIPAGHLASLSGAHSHVSSAEACLCPRGKKGGRQTMGRTFTTLLPFFSF